MIAAEYRANRLFIGITLLKRRDRAEPVVRLGFPTPSRVGAAGRSRARRAEQRAVRSLRAVASTWPSAGMSTDSRFVSVRRKQRASRAQILVLAGCAFVLGLALSAAVFVGVWRTTARQSDRSSAQRALADHRLRATLARSATLSLQLQRTEASLLTARGEERQLRLALPNTTRGATG